MINHADDVDFVEGVENHNITWTPTDDFPATFGISVNGSGVDSGSWTSGNPIVLELDDFEVGIHNCTIIVYDIAGNYAMDSVLVNVTAADTTTSGNEIVDLIIDNILYISIGAIGLIGVVVFMKRRS